MAVFVLATLQQPELVNSEVSVIVLCHTHELAFQIKNEYTRPAKYMPDVRVGTFLSVILVAKDAELLRDKSILVLWLRPAAYSMPRLLYI
ncbi:hypothetical protein C8Q70DRAFT_916846 [Cubamyces menziesii]|nr:hypothetical protein C8Q70DRAFT_916846 [Cubamyces menziesii]